MTIKTISALAIVLGLAASAAAEQPDYEFTWDWVSQDSSVWLEHLGNLKGKPNLRALEVGSYEGRSASTGDTVASQHVNFSSKDYMMGSR